MSRQARGRLTVQWSLVQGGSPVRFRASLAGLLAAPEPAEASGVRALLVGLAAILPLDARPDHPWAQLDHCARQAWEIARDPRTGLAPNAIDLVVSAYETGLLAGFDGNICCVSDDLVEPLTREDLSAIHAIARRHGEALRRWWRSYAELARACFGDASFGNASS